MAVPYSELPHNPEAEKATLGSAMMSKSAADEVLASLHAADFFDERHQKVFLAFESLNHKNMAIDVQTVTEELKNSKSLEDVGGVDYLYELTQSMLSVDNIQEYVNILLQNANLRNLLNVMKEIESEYAKKNIENYTAFVADAQMRLNKVADERKISNFIASPDITAKVHEHIYKVMDRRKERDYTGVNTGFRLLNYYTNGLQPQNLIIVAGRPGMGKTAFALQLALNAAILEHRSVGIFEMEMSSIMLYSRLLSNLSDIKGRDILSGHLEQPELKNKINENLEKLAKLKIFVDESSALTIVDIVTKARKLKSEQPDLQLLIIDYLGLIASDTKRRRKYDSRQLEIQEYTRTLHELARELNIPIVLLCQLNRRVEERGEGGTPRLSDLRESGAIEQDADLVLLLHRDNYGKSASAIAQQHAGEHVKAKDMSADARRELVQAAENRVATENAKNNQQAMYNASPIMHVYIAKQRNGQSDTTVNLMFETEYSRFSDLSPEFEKRQSEILSKNNYLDEE